MPSKVKKADKEKQKQPRKVKKTDKETQKQEQKQTLIVNVGDVKKTKPKPRKKRAPKNTRELDMYRIAPQTVYKPSPLSFYSDIIIPEGKSETPARSITLPTEPVKTAPILEDTGIVGTEGRGVEIMDVPTKKETLAELITPVALPKEDSGRAIARETIEPSRISKPIDMRAGLLPTAESDTASQISGISMRSVPSIGSEKSFRFPEPSTFRYSDVERIGPSPYASEKSISSFGFPESETEKPTALDRNVFMEQQASFMEKSKKAFNQKPEITKPASKATRKKKQPKMTEVFPRSELIIPDKPYIGPEIKRVEKPISKMNKEELKLKYKQLTLEPAPNMSYKNLKREVMGLVSR